MQPHNLIELMNACIALTESRKEGRGAVSDKKLFRMIPGPDFPTGASIMGYDNAKKLYKTGNGGIIVRAITHVEEIKYRKGSRSAIIVTELPYQVREKDTRQYK